MIMIPAGCSGLPGHGGKGVQLFASNSLTADGPCRPGFGTFQRFLPKTPLGGLFGRFS
jgi:hypothetical protein